MRLAAREDIELPASVVFAAASDFDHFARLALRRGFQVERRDRLPEPAVGMRWSVSGPYGGKLRHVTAELRAYVPGESLLVRMTGGGFEVDIDVDVIALSWRRTRLRTDLDLRPRTIRARILMQALKLRRAKAVGRFHASLRAFARRIELRHMIDRA